MSTEQEENIGNNKQVGTQKIIIPVIEEKLIVETGIVETAKVHLSKRIVEHIEPYSIPFSAENVIVERIAKNEYVDTPPPALRYEGDVMIVSVLKEVAVLEKRLMLVEELHIKKHKTEKIESGEIVLKKEDVDINRTVSDTPH